MSLDTTPTSPRDPFATSRRFTFAERLRERLLRPGRHWVFVSVAMYVLACVLPAMPAIFADHTITGWACLVWMSYTFPPWWANPTYFVAIIAALLNRTRISVVFAVVAALLAMSYELMEFIERGVPGAVERLRPGCLFWISSLELLAYHELWRQWLEWRQRQECLEHGPDESV